MKKILFALFIVSAMLGANAQSADEIVKKHIDAIGGEANWRKVKSIRLVASTKAQGADISVTRTVVDKKAMRMDIEVFGMKGWSIITNTAGWNFMPFAGQTKYEAMTADDVKDSQDQLEVIDEFITYKEKGKKIEYVGKDDMDGVECLKLKLTDKDGKVTQYWLDPTSYYTLKSLSKATVNGKEVEAGMTFSNYKKVEGTELVYAYSMGGDMGDVEVKTIEINGKIDDSLFVPTESK